MSYREINNEEIEENDDSNAIQNEQNNKKNFVEEDKTVESLQISIQKLNKKIEEDKINLRILQERYIKKQSEYNQLAGKPITKSKEQKLEEMKEKMKKIKNRQIFDPNYGKKNPVPLPDEETKIIEKNTDKRKIELDNLIDSINKQVLYNTKLSHEIEEVRKEKSRIYEKLEKINEENKILEKEIDQMKNRNNKIYNKIHFKELNKVKERGKTLESQFLEKRDYLENEYHKVIQANIKIEKEHKSNLSQLRLKNAVFADKARKNGSNSMIIHEMKIEDQEELQDRMPILDLLTDKWVYIIKYKRNMLDRYIKYSNEVRICFEKLLDYLGLEKLDQLPDIYNKNEQQMTAIESYLSSISSEVDDLNEKKCLLEKQIDILEKTQKMDQEEKLNIMEERKSKIQTLKKYNDELEGNINRRKQIFKDLEQPTLDFLRKMQKTYLVDFVVNKINVEESTKLNEKNIITFLGTIYCYCQLIKDFDENVKNKNSKNKESNDINKTIDLLKKDIKTKIMKINYNNCVNGNIHSSINNVVKHGNDFDETIRRLANVIVDQVNNNSDNSLNNISTLKTNNMST